MEQILTFEEDRMMMELKEIFQLLDRKIYFKLPSDVKEKVESYQGRYKFEYDKSKSLNDQNILQITKDFIVFLFYPIADDESKEQIKKNIELEEKRKLLQEKMLREKIANEDIFKTQTKTEKTKENIVESAETAEQMNLTVVKPKTFISKIMDKIKSFFKKKEGNVNGI